MKTYSARASELQPRWYVFDAQDQVLGRFATQVAHVLRGKHKPTYTPSINGGDFVIVINAEKIAVTGNRLEDKLYHRHSGYPGGLKTETLRQSLEKHPERPIEIAVKGMLPHNRLGADMLARLKVYVGPNHPHQAQMPVAWNGPVPEMHVDIVRDDPLYTGRHHRTEDEDEIEFIDAVDGDADIDTEEEAEDEE